MSEPDNAFCAFSPTHLPIYTRKQNHMRMLYTLSHYCACPTGSPSKILNKSFTLGLILLHICKPPFLLPITLLSDFFKFLRLPLGLFIQELLFIYLLSLVVHFLHPDTLAFPLLYIFIVFIRSSNLN